MKKLLLSLTLVGFAVAVQAADNKAQATPEKPSCCAQAKATAEAGSCPMAKGTCSKMAKNSKGATAKQALLSPKAASFAAR